MTDVTTKTPTPRSDDVAMRLPPGDSLTAIIQSLTLARELERELATLTQRLAGVTEERDEVLKPWQALAIKMLGALHQAYWPGVVDDLRAPEFIRRLKNRAESAESLVTSLSVALRELVTTERLLRANDERARGPSIEYEQDDDLIEPVLAALLIRHGDAWKAAFDLVAALPEDAKETK